ncbi:MAG: branched-chain amino acid ABC transporter permease [Candidatus Bathyarchaeota archaeon]|nr:branched-chain amino acid ABC transporter permease [Candidatus Bathyarchaeota archaeon]
MEFIKNERLKDFRIQLLLLMAAISSVLLLQDSYISHLVVLCMIYGAVALNWNIAVGYSGILHLAQVPFFVLGAYTTAILATKFGISTWFGLLAAPFVVMALALVLGVVSLRVKGIYLLFITLGVQFLMLSVVLYFVEWTNGDMGLIVPPLEIFGTKINQFNIIPSFLIALVLVISSLTLNKKIIDSELGLAIVSLRDSEDYAISRGVNPFKVKLSVFVLSSWLTGISGAFYSNYLGTIGPTELGWYLVILFLTSLVIGGMQSLYGPLLGAFILIFSSEFFRAAHLFRPTIYGGLVIITLIFLPKGVISLIPRIGERIFERAKH